jgi:hypothetical protein
MKTLGILFAGGHSQMASKQNPVMPSERFSLERRAKMSNQSGSVEATSKQGFKEGEEGPLVTDRTCTANLTNNWNGTITNITMTHRSGDKSNQMQLGSLGQGDTSGELEINFETGVGSSHDYWWITFTSGTSIWSCKDNFYCDLRSSDAGKLVKTSVNSDDNDWVVTEPSGECYVSLNNVG